LSERKPRAAGGPESQPGPAQLLLELLELSLGNQTVARAAVAHALGLAGRDELPRNPSELLGFVRAHLVSILTGELGPRLTLALLDDLEAKLDPAPANSHIRPRRTETAEASSPPSSSRRELGKLDFRWAATPAPSALLGVLVVDPDRVQRPVLARALLRARWSVTMIDSPADLGVAFEAGERFGAALVRMDHPLADTLLAEVVARYPDAVIIARGNDPHRARARLAELGVARHDVRPSDAPAEELVDAIRRSLGL
jgi:hypothetical protein